MRAFNFPLFYLVIVASFFTQTVLTEDEQTEVPPSTQTDNPDADSSESIKLETGKTEKTSDVKLMKPEKESTVAGLRCVLVVGLAASKVVLISSLNVCFWKHCQKI